MNEALLNGPPPFEEFLREREVAETYISQCVEVLGECGFVQWYLDELTRESKDGNEAYPSQGLVRTPYDPPESLEFEVEEMDDETKNTVLSAWLYYLLLFNHPERIEALEETPEYKPPKGVWFSPIFTVARVLQRTIAFGDLGMHIVGAEKERTKRTERFKEGPFVMLGKQARAPFVGSANPEIWGSASAIASMAMSHCLVGVPRDGVFSNVKRQADLASKVFEWIENSPALRMLEETNGGGCCEEMKNKWKRNVMGVLEANPEKALKRMKMLYEAGVRTFRIYSPEPGTGPVETLKKIRETYGDEVEVFVGQVVSYQQAKDLEKAGADGLYLGIAGGGRCSTGIRSGSVVDTPQLAWKLTRRKWGKIKIPLIVEGGGSDHIAQSWAVGITGIGVTRAVGGGTVEAPGGWRFLKSLLGKLGKLYGGEASARVKSMGNKTGPYDNPPYVEGETTFAWRGYDRGDVPTILQKVYLLFGDAILAMVFQNVDSVPKFMDQAVRTLRQVSDGERFQRSIH